MRTMRWFMGTLFGALLLWQTGAAAQAPGQAWLIDIRGAIGPATADHVVRGLRDAAAAGAPLAVLRMDTPGGLDNAMRDMVREILASPIPVVGYVAPGGARAASAGTYLLYASHVAAMAPGTNLGAATPVQIGGPSMPSPTPQRDTDAPRAPAGSGEQPDDPAPQPASAMEKKLVNDAAAYIESLAELRGRNAEWAVRAVREGVSLSAEDALELGVVDLLAASERELLEALDGREVDIGSGSLTLATAGTTLYVHEVDWRSEFLAIITDPNIAYVLMLIGIYGLIIEFYNPGVGLPGVVGAVSLLLALYAFQALPISYAGLGLILLGIGLMTAEAFSPSFGVFGVGGVIAFVVGSIMLMDTRLPGYQIALPMILAFALFSAGLLAVALNLILRARRQAVVSGAEHLLGARGVVESMAGGNPMVRLDGELWSARSDQPLSRDDRVTVDALDELTLLVSKTKDDD